MKKFLKYLSFSFILCAMALSLGACNEDNEKSLPEGTLYDIVTLTANDDDGSVFQFQKDGDSPMITLVSSRKLPETVKVGERLFIAYVPVGGVSYVSGAIDLIAYQSVLNDDIKIGTAEEYDGFLTEDQRLTYLTRTGKYLNVAAEIYVLHSPKIYRLVCDEETLDDKYPVCYIQFFTDSGADGRIYTGRASFDISEVWNRPNVEGIVVRLSNTDGANEFTFKKSKETITPTE